MAKAKLTLKQEADMLSAVNQIKELEATGKQLKKQADELRSQGKAMRKPTDTGNRCFDQFWAMYPRKVGKEKARRAFEKIQPSETELQKMLAELERQRKVYHWGKENWKFIPHPATWLNQRRWEDETIAAEDDIPDDDPYGAFVY